MQLVTPHHQYKESFLKAMIEYQHEGYKTFIDYDLPWVLTHFDHFLDKLALRPKGLGLPEGYVADSQFWLVDHGEYIGNTGIRHTLTPNLLKVGGHIGYDITPSKRKMGYGTKILELALVKAKELGINKVLVTCDETNIGSKKIIEKNGGVLEDRVEAGAGQPNKLRYWIQQ